MNPDLISQALKRELEEKNSLLREETNLSARTAYSAVSAADMRQMDYRITG